jgi:hypothetical protein
MLEGISDDELTELKITKPDDPDDTNELVPKYLDEWPDNPMDDDDDYVVVVTKTENGTGDIMYSIEVKVSSELEEE